MYIKLIDDAYCQFCYHQCNQTTPVVENNAKTCLIRQKKEMSSYWDIGILGIPSVRQNVELLRDVGKSKYRDDKEHVPAKQHNLSINANEEKTPDHEK